MKILWIPTDLIGETHHRALYKENQMTAQDYERILNATPEVLKSSKPMFSDKATDTISDIVQGSIFVAGVVIIIASAVGSALQNE